MVTIALDVHVNGLKWFRVCGTVLNHCRIDASNPEVSVQTLQWVHIHTKIMMHQMQCGRCFEAVVTTETNTELLVAHWWTQDTAESKYAASYAYCEVGGAEL